MGLQRGSLVLPGKFRVNFWEELALLFFISVMYSVCIISFMEVVRVVVN